MYKGWLSHIDLLLVIPVLVLLLFSLITLFSISHTFFTNQLIFSLLCCLVFFFFSQVDLENISGLAVPLYIVSIIALLVVLGIGFESRGAIRWVDILGFRLQFSEILKPVLIFCFAVFLAKQRAVSLKTLGLILLFLTPVLLLIYKQPDLGNAIIYAFVVIITLLIYGMPLWWFLTGGIILAVLLPFSFRFLHGYQQQRLLTFLHITNDPLGNSYNAIQSIIAVGSGKLTGKGLGGGTQSTLRFLPERHTDFLFATLSEDLGFLGALLVIITFIILFYRMFTILQYTNSKTEKIFVLGALSLILVQFFVNVGMNIGLLPIVGVTLPFMSYGGSSLFSNTILLGIVSSISYQAKRKHGLVIT